MSKLHDNRVEIGQLTTTQRDALGSVPNGTVIYNTSANELQFYYPAGWNPVSKGGSMNGTGGSTSTSSRPGYKVHIFTSPGTFQLTAGQGDVEYRVVAGGGGGGEGCSGGTGYETGGGGAGGHRTGTLAVTPGSYSVTVGGGGGDKSSGSNSSFHTITSTGGGAGGGHPGGRNGLPGGSGGGGAHQGNPSG